MEITLDLEFYFLFFWKSAENPQKIACNRTIFLIFSWAQVTFLEIFLRHAPIFSPLDHVCIISIEIALKYILAVTQVTVMMLYFLV